MAKKMTKVEYQRLLDASIRREAAWELKNKSGANALGVAVEDAVLSKAARAVYDDIVGRTAYNDQMLSATRSVKNFSMTYVRGVIASAVESGLMETMIEAAKEAAFISETAKHEVAAGGVDKGMQACIKKMTPKMGGDEKRAAAVCATMNRKKGMKAKK